MASKEIPFQMSLGRKVTADHLTVKDGADRGLHPLSLPLSPFTLWASSANNEQNDCQEPQVSITPSRAFLSPSIHQWWEEL